jgi:hypothetical protein
MTIPSGGVKGKNRAMDFLRVVLRELQLDLEEGEVGSHSIWKCASTHLQGNSVSKDDKDTRGQWKATGRVSDRYILNKIKEDKRNRVTHVSLNL